MQKLHPKSIWLFFLQSLPGWIVFFLVFFGWFLLPLLTIREPLEFKSTELLTLNVLLIMVVVPLALSYIFARLSYRFYFYELSELGFKKEYGIIWKKYVTIPYDRIQNVDIFRGVFARLLGLSDLHIQTAGASGAVLTEGRLPGLSREVAEQLRDELIIRARHARSGIPNQGL